MEGGANMKIGITQIILNDWPLTDMLDLCEEAGYEALELHFSQSGTLDPDLADDAVARIGRRCAQRGVQVASVLASYTGPSSLLSPDRKAQELGRRALRRALELAGILQADTVLLHPGQLAATGTYQQAWERLQDPLHQLLPVAEAHGAAIAIENVWNKFLLSPREMCQFIDGLGSPWLGAYLDTANMMAYGHPEHWIRALGTRIKKVHVKDFDRKAHSFVDLLDGDTDWPTVMAELREAGYAGPIIHEVGGSRQALLETASRMRRIVKM